MYLVVYESFVIYIICNSVRTTHASFELLCTAKAPYNLNS